MEARRIARAIGAALLCARPVEADLIVAYDSANAEQLEASRQAAGITPQPLSRGSGISQASGSTFNSRDWSQDASAAADKYLEWGWTSEDKWDLSHLAIRYDRSSSGPEQLEIGLSADGAAFQIVFADSSISSGGEQHLAIDLSTWKAVQSATFRLYAFAASSSAGTLDIENFTAGQGLTVHGSTTAVPEPSLAWVLVALLWLQRKGSRSVKSLACKASSGPSPPAPLPKQVWGEGSTGDEPVTRISHNADSSW